jgi:hypothetical protein
MLTHNFYQKYISLEKSPRLGKANNDTFWKYYAGQKILAVIVCQFKKKKCNPYFIVIMITVLIMNVIFWVVNFKTQNYFVISTTYTERLPQVIYVRLI